MLLEFFLDVKKGIMEDGIMSKYTFNSAFSNIIDSFQTYLCDEEKAFDVDENEEGEIIYTYLIKKEFWFLHMLNITGFYPQLISMNMSEDLCLMLS